MILEGFIWKILTLKDKSLCSSKFLRQVSWVKKETTQISFQLSDLISIRIDDSLENRKTLSLIGWTKSSRFVWWNFKANAFVAIKESKKFVIDLQTYSPQNNKRVDWFHWKKFIRWVFAEGFTRGVVMKTSNSAAKLYHNNRNSILNARHWKCFRSFRWLLSQTSGTSVSNSLAVISFWCANCRRLRIRRFSASLSLSQENGTFLVGKAKQRESNKNKNFPEAKRTSPSIDSRKRSSLKQQFKTESHSLLNLQSQWLHYRKVIERAEDFIICRNLKLRIEYKR